MEQEINYSQFTETEEAKLVLIHEPSYEIFMSMLHPAGSLYKGVTSESMISKDFENLKTILKIHGVRAITIREALLMDRPSLIELATNCLHYHADEKEESPNDALFSHYMSDAYKKEILNKMTNNQLIDVILTRPYVKLKRSQKNTFIETSNVSFKPLGNLIYVRDTQVTTQRGIIIGRSDCEVRKLEKIVIKQVLKNIKAKVIGEIPERCFLEGGDIFTLRPDLAMLGIGLRSNMEAAYYMMENDLIECDKLALCIDVDDLDQERMHLDTFFNVLNSKTVLIIDFENLSKLKGKRINRKIQVYSKNAEELSLNGKLDDKSYGCYYLIKEYDDIYTFFQDNGFTYIKCTLSQQEQFIFNFLNLGEKLIIAINKELKELVKKHKVDVKVIDMEFDAVKNLYGGVRCATQVYRNIHSD